MESIEEQQKKICLKHTSVYIPPEPMAKVGIAISTLGEPPLNGLRLVPEANTCGWYIWGGEEFSTSPDFFQPLHIEHLSEYCPEILPFLALAPGWRILLANNYEDVWYDDSLFHS